MIEIIAGVLAGTGWLLGIFLYRWTREEISGFSKRMSLSFIQAIVFSAILGAVLAYKLDEFSSTLVFAGTLFASSLYGIKRKSRQQIMFFLVHVIVFLIAFYTAQVFLI